ncbi:hypothetical protein ZWY2020_025045 [Hordeum vulgare]|nr:hypothetical protein ZWY2020_025045 [Hordeum vulgare]
MWSGEPVRGREGPAGRSWTRCRGLCSGCTLEGAVEGAEPALEGRKRGSDDTCRSRRPGGRVVRVRGAAPSKAGVWRRRHPGPARTVSRSRSRGMAPSWDGRLCARHSAENVSLLLRGLKKEMLVRMCMEVGSELQNDHDSGESVAYRGVRRRHEWGDGEQR